MRYIDHYDEGSEPHVIECQECGYKIDPYDEQVVCVGNAFYCSNACWEK